MGLSFKNTILGGVLVCREEGAEMKQPPLSKPGQWQGFKGLEGASQQQPALRGSSEVETSFPPTVPSLGNLRALGHPEQALLPSVVYLLCRQQGEAQTNLCP